MIFYLERRAQAFRGFGTSLKPAFEPIILGMKPCDGTFGDNNAEHGLAGMDIDASRVGTRREPRLMADVLVCPHFTAGALK